MDQNQHFLLMDSTSSALEWLERVEKGISLQIVISRAFDNKSDELTVFNKVFYKCTKKYKEPIELEFDQLEKKYVNKVIATLEQHKNIFELLSEEEKKTKLYPVMHMMNYFIEKKIPTQESKPTTSSTVDSGVLLEDQSISSQENVQVEELQVDDSVMKIPKLFRHNFSTSCFFELDECPVALKFWFNGRYADVNKYFLKLHDDSGDFQNKKFLILEQVGLGFPQKHLFPLEDILDILTQIPNKRIWLDVVDFNLFTRANENLLQSIESDITHFSFGSGLRANNRIEPHHLLEFLFNHLPSVEYLAVNNTNLWTASSSLSKSGTVEKLKKRTHSRLKTVRFIHEFFKFDKDFIFTLLDCSQNLMNVCGLPLHYLKEYVKTHPNYFETTSIRSLFVKRDYYNQKETGAAEFFEHLNIFYKHGGNDKLAEFDTRTFFLHCKPAVRTGVIKLMSLILHKNVHSLKKLTVEPGSTLMIPKLERLETIQFFMDRKTGGPRNETCFFPFGFDVPAHLPNLKKVEIILSFAGRTHVDPPPTLFDWQFPPSGFKGGDMFKSVQSLTLKGFTPLECMPRISELFPNLLILRLFGEIKDIGEILPHCFESWNLKELEVAVNVNRSLNLDSALIGVSERVCELLRSAPEEVQDEEIWTCVKNGDLNKWNEFKSEKDTNDELGAMGRKEASPQPRRSQEKTNKYVCSLSICHLKDLELFKIIVGVPDKQHGDELPILTRIGALALSFCGLGDEGENKESKLKVQIGFSERLHVRDREHMMSSLSSLSTFPFISIEH